MGLGFGSLKRIDDITSNGGFIFPVERITARGSQLYKIGLDQLITNVFGMEVTGSNLDVTSGKTFRIDTALDTFSTGTAYTVLAGVPASSTVTLGIASTIFDFLGTSRATTVTIKNAGVGTNPTLTSDAATQIATLTGSLTVTGDLVIQGASTILETATLSVEDPTIVMNRGGAANSETLSGIYIEAAAANTAYIRVQELGPVDTDDAWEFKVPDNANPLRLGLNLLTATRTLTAPDLSGTIAVLAAAATFTNLSLTDNTNQIVFDSDGARTTTISVPLPAVASRTYTVPDFGADDSFVGLAATQTLLNKSLTSPAITGGSAIELATLSIRDSAAAFDVRLLSTSTGLLADRTLTFNIQNADKTLTLSGSATLNQDVSTAGSPTFVALSVSGTDIIMDSDSFSTTLRESATANRVVTIPDFTGTLYISGGTDVAVADGGTGVSTFGGVNTILFTTAADTISSIVTGNSGVLVTSGAGVPSIATDIPTAVTIGAAYVYRVSGTDVAVADGGTGVSTLADGGLVIGNAAGAVEVVAAGLTTQILVGGGALTAPVWGTDIPTAVTIGAAYIHRVGGTDVALLDGGTNASLAASNGAVVYSTAAAMALSAVGTANQVFVSAGAGAPVWSAITMDGSVANVIDVRNGTGLLNIAAATSLDINANFTVNTATTMAAYANTICNTANEAAFKAAANLEAGTDFHAYTANGNTILTDAGLLNIAGVVTAADQFLYTTAADTFAAQAITATGRNLVGTTIAIDQIVYGTGAGTWTTTGLTAAARSILDDATVGAIATTLVLGAASSVTHASLLLTAGFNTIFTFTETQDVASQRLGVFELDRATPTDADEFFIDFRFSDSLGNQEEFVRFKFIADDITEGTEDGAFVISIRAAGGGVTDRLRLDPATLRPASDDGLTLGVSGAAWSDLFLAVNAVINFDAGDVTITHAANSLTVAGGTFNATGGGALTGTWSDLGSVTAADLNGGTIDGMIIGGAVAAAGTFTTCDATTDFTVGSLVITSNVLTATGRLTTAMTTPTVGTGFDGAQTALWAIKGRVGAAGPVISEFIVDLTNLINSTTANDIIGESAAVANCHFGQITAAIQGTIQAIEVVCLETPAGGDPDIDIYSAVESTGAENALVTDLTETLILARGASWANGDVRGTTAVPAANEYLYLAVGSAGGAPGTYTAGKFKITIYGTV